MQKHIYRGKYTLRVNDETKLLEIDSAKIPMAYSAAVDLATRNARLTVIDTRCAYRSCRAG